jgi:cell division septal protein FtsQ
VSHTDYFKHIQKNEYGTHRYRNPYFKKDKKISKIKTLSLVSCSIVFLFSTVYLVFFCGFFDVRSVSIAGIEKIQKKDIETVINKYLNTKKGFIFKNKNFFVYDNDALRKAITDNFGLTEIQIKREVKSLQIVIQERISNLIWRTGDKNFLVDINGIVMQEISSNDYDGMDLPIFVDFDAITVNTGNNVLTKNEITAVFDFYNMIGELGIQILTTNINRVAGKWMSAATNKGYDIYFDAFGDIRKQADNLKILIEQNKFDFDSIEYIDLRFGDQVYYK